MKYIRLMIQTCAAQELCPYAMQMCWVIAAKEDEMRYSKPILFWNQQLLDILNIAKWDRLNKARSTAISHGWLHYRSLGRKKQGEYWVTIPEAYKDTLPDIITPHTGYNDGYKEGYNDGYNKGEPPNLYLNPNPIPLSEEIRPEIIKSTAKIDGKEKKRLRKAFNRYVYLHSNDPVKFAEFESEFWDIIENFGEDQALIVAKSEWESKVANGAKPENAKIFTNQLDAILATQEVLVHTPESKPLAEVEAAAVIRKQSGEAIWEVLGEDVSMHIANKHGFKMPRFCKVLNADSFNIWYAERSLDERKTLNKSYQSALISHFEGQA